MHVRDLITGPPITVAPDTPVLEARRIMQVRSIRHLPVLEDGRLVGIVSRYDLLRLFHRPDAAIAAEIDAKLADPLYAPENHAVQASVDDGVVTLAGRVRLEGEEALVHGLAERVPGVVRVIDRVTFEEPISRRR
jgi:CBS domain-containing protein